MKVKDLKKLIAKMDDNILVVTSGQDHSYREVFAQKTTALSGNHKIFEDFGDEYIDEDCKRIKILLVN